MDTYTQEFNDAIRSADREMKGYIQFNGDSSLRMYGSDGLISFTETQQIMEQERYCIGGAVSCRCEASFFNSGIPSGVSLASSYFDVYVGVKVADTDGDTYTGTVFESQQIFLDGGEYETLTGDSIGDTPVGSTVTLHVNNTVATGTWTANGLDTTVNGIRYEIINSDGAWQFNALDVDNAIFLSGSFTVSATFEADAFEYKCMGRFYIAEVSRGKETTAVVGYDAVNHFLSEKYVPTVTKSSSGYLAKDILNDIVAQTGVQGGTAFTSSIFNFYVPEIVEATCRETWGWLMCCAYNTSRPGVNTFGSLGTLGNVAMRSYSIGEEFYTSYPAITDDQIYMDGLTMSEDPFVINSITTGTEDSPIVIGSGVGINSPNPYITTAQATNIYNALHGLTYMPMSLHFRGDPCISLFDSLKVTQDGTDYRCICMKITSTFNGGFEQTIDCWGDSEAYYEMSYSPMESKIQTNNTLIKEIAQSIETARGGVITQILDDDGKWTELTIANNQDLSSATSVWRFNINGLAHSSSYTGGTYTFALDAQGRIVATLIQTGILQDSQGKNYWNLDTGDFRITNGSIHITTNSQTYDAINLSYSNWSARMAPLEFSVENSSTKRSFLIQAGGIYGYSDYTASTPKHDTLITPNGGIWLGGGGNQGGVVVYNATGTETAVLSGDGSLNLGTSGASGYLGIHDTGGVKRLDVTADLFAWYNGTNKYTALLWPDSAGAGRLILGDGTSTKWRVSLENTGLTFRNSSDAVTALYPADGLTVQYETAITTSIPNATDTAVASVTLGKGKWLVIGNVGFASNATGRRYVGITTSSTSTTSGAIARSSCDAMTGGMTMFSLSQVVTLTATSTTYYLVCYQNSGSALTSGGNTLRAIKLP